MQSILYSATPCSAASSSSSLVLRQALQLLWNADDSSFAESLQQQHQPILLTHSAWRHDEESGRGAILVAQGSAEGRVWRWETGGGPIPIGRTLVLDQAGCRSIACRAHVPYRGVGAMAQDAKAALVLAELGEGRIVRLEEETGARTPLVINVPVPSTICGAKPVQQEKQEDGGEELQNKKETIHWQRIQSPRHMQVTNGGDLLFLDNNASTDCMILWQRKRVDQTVALASLAESRRAHEWTSLPQETTSEDMWHVVFSAEAVGGFLVIQDKVTTLSKVLVTASLPTWGVVILEIPLADDDDDDDNDDEDDEKVTKRESRIIFRLQRYLPTALEPGPLVMTEKKKTIFLATNEGIAMLLPQDGDYRLAGLLRLPIMDRPSITSLTLGQDSYLYVTTESRLWRIKIQD